MENDNKKYKFNQMIAKDVGFEEAVMLSSLYFWIQLNEKKQQNYHQDKYWTYNTIRFFTELYPFWTSSQIRRILTNLKNKDYIETGSFNKKGFDKTKWYTVTDKTLAYLENDEASAEKDILF